MRNDKNKKRNKACESAFFAAFILLMFAGIASAQTVSPESGFPDTPALVVVSKYMPYPAEPGKYIDVWLKITDYSTQNMNNLVFKLTPRYPFYLYEGDTAERMLGDLVPGEQAVMKYKIKVDDKAVEGNNLLDFQYTYTGRILPQTSSVELAVQSLHPDIEVTDINVMPGDIEPNKASTVSIKIKNNADSTLQDISVKLDLSSTDTPFVPINSLNEKRINVIESGEEKELNFTITATSSADAQIYKVPVVITYADKLGNNFSKQNYVGLVVGGKPDLAEFIDKSTVVGKGAKGTVTLKVVNKGLTGVKLMYAVLKSNDNLDVISPEGAYIGKIDNDDYSTADFTIVVKKTKNDVVDLPFVIQYKDANNNDYTDSITLPLDLRKSKLNNPSSGSGLTLFIAAVIIVGGYFLYRRWKKKKFIKLAK